MPPTLTADPAAFAVPEPKRKCAVADVLEATTIDLLKVSPDHPTARALAQAALQQPLPKELVAWEPIKDWIELNIDPAKIIAAKPQPSRFISAPPAMPNGGLAVRVEATETESGSCNYTCSCYGQHTYNLNRETILSAVRDSDGLDDLVDTLHEELSNLVDDNPPDTSGNTDDYDYSDHESSDHGDFNWNVRGSLTEAVRAWLAANAPEELERLGGNE